MSIQNLVWTITVKFFGFRLLVVIFNIRKMKRGKITQPKPNTGKGSISFLLWKTKNGSNLSNLADQSQRTQMIQLTNEPIKTQRKKHVLWRRKTRWSKLGLVLVFWFCQKVAWVYLLTNRVRNKVVIMQNQLLFGTQVETILSHGKNCWFVPCRNKTICGLNENGNKTLLNWLSVSVSWDNAQPLGSEVQRVPPVLC